MTHPISSGFALRRWFWTLIFTLSLGSGAFAQNVDWNRYQPVQAVAPIPEDMRMTSTDKYERDLKQVDQSKKKRQQEAHERFLLQSNFQLDEILLSGKVLFNDPITQYVTKVKDIILKGQPELQKQIRVYVVKSPVVNAFATNSGVLLVNMGLIAHLRTEADLAVVLCHEIQHYIKKHPLNTYMNASELKDNAKMLGLKNTEDYLAAKARYSREVETEADGMGFELYKNSGYTRGPPRPSLTSSWGRMSHLTRYLGTGATSNPSICVFPLAMRNGPSTTRISRMPLMIR
ncbi:MAG: M48 family metallopeptidase [Bacteroidia bacterium]